MTIGVFRHFLVYFCLVLTACGGGSSSSGGGQASDPSRDVSACISRTDEVRVEPPGEFGGPEMRWIDTTLTNTCDFAVNVGIAQIFDLSRSVPLGPDMSVTNTALSPFQTSFIACRPPSQPINTCNNVLCLKLRCSAVPGDQVA